MEKNYIFWDVTPCTPLYIVCHLCPQGRRISQTNPTCSRWRANFSTLKMELTFSSQTSFVLQRSRRRYMPEDGHRCENRKSCINCAVPRYLIVSIYLLPSCSFLDWDMDPSVWFVLSINLYACTLTCTRTPENNFDMLLPFPCVL
jgi:hypothetical protein